MRVQDWSSLSGAAHLTVGQIHSPCSNAAPNPSHEPPRNSFIATSSWLTRLLRKAARLARRGAIWNHHHPTLPCSPSTAPFLHAVLFETSLPRSQHALHILFVSKRTVPREELALKVMVRSGDGSELWIAPLPNPLPPFLSRQLGKMMKAALAAGCCF